MRARSTNPNFEATAVVIYTGDKKEARGPNYKPPRAVHIYSRQVDAVEAKQRVRAYLKHPSYVYFSNLPTPLITCLSWSSSPHLKKKVVKMIGSHSRAQSQLSNATVFDISDIDRRLAFRTDVRLSVRLVIMRWKTKEGGPLFMRIGPTYTGTGLSFTFPTKYEAEAQERLNHLPAYLVHELGNGVMDYLSEEGRQKAMETTWDDALGRPVSQEERYTSEGIELCSSTGMKDWFVPEDPLLVSGEAPARPEKGTHVWDAASRQTFHTNASAGTGDASSVSGLTGASSPSKGSKHTRQSRMKAAFAAVLHNQATTGDASAKSAISSVGTAANAFTEEDIHLIEQFAEHIEREAAKKAAATAGASKQDAPVAP